MTHKLRDEGIQPHEFGKAIEEARRRQLIQCAEAIGPGFGFKPYSNSDTIVDFAEYMSNPDSFGHTFQFDVENFRDFLVWLGRITTRTNRLVKRGDKWERAGYEQPLGVEHQLTPRRIVLKVPGHNYWSGRGQQSYAGAEFQIYEILRQSGDDLVCRADPITFPVRK